MNRQGQNTPCPGLSRAPTSFAAPPSTASRRGWPGQARPRGGFVSWILFQFSCFGVATALLLFSVPAVAMQIQPVAGASGVEAWLVEDHSVPVVTIRFAFPGGAAITRDDLAAFAAERFHRRGLTIGIVGDIGKAEAAALLDRVFGNLPLGSDDSQIAEAKPLDDGALVVSRAAVPQSVVTFGQTG